MTTNSQLVTLGRYLVVDSRIGHGKPTFRGTRIFVADVLQQVAEGMSWEAIIEEWNGNLTTEAIAEAVQLASQALLDHADQFAVVVVDTLDFASPGLRDPNHLSQCCSSMMFPSGSVM